MQKLSTIGLEKCKKPIYELFTGSVFGGIYIAIGCWLFLVIRSKVDLLVAAVAFPAGLSFVLLTQSELLTSSMGYLLYPWFTFDGRRAICGHNFANVLRILAVNLAGNWFACSTMIWYMSISGVDESFLETLNEVATHKTSGTMIQTFMRGVGANFMVNLAVYQASLTDFFYPKLFLLWLPIFTFVMLGLEHSVANMFFLGCGLRYGSISLSSYLMNLIPCIMGNLIGAMFFVISITCKKRSESRHTNVLSTTYSTSQKLDQQFSIVNAKACFV